MNRSIVNKINVAVTKEICLLKEEEEDINPDIQFEDQNIGLQSSKVGHNSTRLFIGCRVFVSGSSPRRESTDIFRSSKGKSEGKQSFFMLWDYFY